MKTKEEILKMNESELRTYKWNDDLNLKKDNSNCLYCLNCSDCSYCSYCLNCSDCLNCFDCSYCLNCSHCSHCSHCSDCSSCLYCLDCSGCFDLVNGLFCRNLKLNKRDYKKYFICNIEVTKKEFEKKKDKLGDKFK